MCKYRYSEAYCAHSKVSGRECVGEDRCHVQRIKQHKWSELDCSQEHRYGPYCAKYQRFYCAGRDHCDTPEQYLDSLVRFRSDSGGT
jgi:hypothetical protein